MKLILYIKTFKEGTGNRLLAYHILTELLGTVGKDLGIQPHHFKFNFGEYYFIKLHESIKLTKAEEMSFGSIQRVLRETDVYEMTEERKKGLDKYLELLLLEGGIY